MEDVERLVRVEERVASLREDFSELKQIIEKHVTNQSNEIKELKAQQGVLVAAIGKWKQGAGLIFLLGGAVAWVIDHWTWLISHIRA